MKPVSYYKDREQTYLKHFFLERYLETVAYHIGSWRKELAYVDCFSGPWRTADQELGDTSIRIALDRLNSVRKGLAQNQRYPSIRALFVEKSPQPSWRFSGFWTSIEAISKRQPCREVSKKTSTSSSIIWVPYLRFFSLIRLAGAALPWTIFARFFSALRAR